MLNLLLEAAEICKNSSNLPTNSHFPLRKQNWLITKSGFKNSTEKSGWQGFASFSNPQNLFLGLNLILSIQMAPRNFRNWKEIESCEPLSIFLKLYDSVNRVICSFWQAHLHQQQEELRASWEFFFFVFSYSLALKKSNCSKLISLIWRRGSLPLIFPTDSL